MEQFKDGFDHYGNNVSLPLGFPWNASSGGTSVVKVITSDSRYAPPAGLPGGCLSLSDPFGTPWIRASLIGGNQPTGIQLVGFKINVLPSTVTDIVSFLDSGGYQVQLALTPLGALQFWRGNLAAQIGASTPNGTVQPNVWCGLILVVTFNGATGAVTLYNFMTLDESP